MILADTSIWIDHFRSGNKALIGLLNIGGVIMHPAVVAELALGSLHERSNKLAMLDLLPQMRVAQMNEVRILIETRRLFNLGMGLTDAQLIAAVLINPPTLLWTKDRSLRKVAESLGLHANLP